MNYRGIDLNTIGRLMDVSTVRTDCVMDEVDEMIEIVKKYHCICASPMPWITKYTIDKLEGYDAVVTGVVGFPGGAETTETKCHIASEMVKLGCKEIDMVINVAALKSGNEAYVKDDVRRVIETAGVPVKTILEVCYLSEDEIKKASLLCVDAGATYIKTGTGWGPTPTTVEHIKLIRKTIGDAAKIKAAGGVKTLDTLIDMYEVGCNRFGVGVRSVKNIFGEVKKFNK